MNFKKLRRFSLKVRAVAHSAAQRRRSPAAQLWRGFRDSKRRDEASGPVQRLVMPRDLNDGVRHTSLEDSLRQRH
jgi:hypothetical protein